MANFSSLSKAKHFIGVVESRADPLFLGRVQVRIYGVHTQDKDAIPTDHLPWATVVNPITNAALSGIGRSPTGILPGTWVFGLFADGEDEQVPFVLGTLVGKPTEEPDGTLGFNDPNENYPLNDPEVHDIGESSVTRLARGEDIAETHSHLVNKRLAKENFGEVETSLASKVPSVLADKADSYYERMVWKEPHPRYGGQDDDLPETVRRSTYPYNHVWYTESGHVLEVDDTPSGERIQLYHTKGTFVEIQPDGNMVTKVNGNQYEITLGDKDVFVKGNVNVTIDGDARILVHGNKIEEIDGDYMLTVRGDVVQKIAGNEAKEILSDKSTQINGNRNERVSKNVNVTTVGNYVDAIKGTLTKTVTGEEKRTNISTVMHIIADNFTLLGANNIDFAAGSNLNLAAEGKLTMKSVDVMTIDTENNQVVLVGGTQTETITGTQSTTASVTNINNNVSVTGTIHADGDIDTSAGNAPTLATHTHKYNPGPGAPTDSSVADA